MLHYKNDNVDEIVNAAHTDMTEAQLDWRLY